MTYRTPFERDLARRDAMRALLKRAQRLLTQGMNLHEMSSRIGSDEAGVKDLRHCQVLLEEFDCTARDIGEALRNETRLGL